MHAYFASQYGPLPPSITAVAVGDLVLLLVLAAVASWADRKATPAELERRRSSLSR